MKKVIILASYLTFSLSNDSYAQVNSTTVKDMNGNDLLYCNDYSMKIGIGDIKLGFNN